MSLSVETKLSSGEAISKSAAHLRAVGFKTEVIGNRLEAVDGRDHNAVVTVLLIIFLTIIGIIYYFTRKKNRMTVISEEGKVSITYEGKKSFTEAERLSALLKS